MTCRIGTIAYATSRGLGHLAHDFYNFGVITDAVVVKHPRIPLNEHWYLNAPSVNLRLREPDKQLLRDFAKTMDALLFFETPFFWDIIPYCREIGVRTYLLTMYECTPKDHPKPYRYLCPSLLDMQYFPDGVFLPLPVEYPWRQRTLAQTYVHNGGYLGLRGREGTTLLIDAMQYVESPLKLIIRVQENVDDEHLRMIEKDPRIEYIPRTVPYGELYGEGEVAVFPQKFNGCSLPLQEAYASGMLIISTDRFPMNTWLPKEPLIPVAGYQKAQIGPAYLEFDEAIIEPRAIARTMDKWFMKDVSEFSLMSKEWAEANSWQELKPLWMTELSK